MVRCNAGQQLLTYSRTIIQFGVHGVVKLVIPLKKDHTPGALSPRIPGLCMLFANMARAETVR